MREDGVIDLELKDGVYVLDPETKIKKENKNVAPGPIPASGKKRKFIRTENRPRSARAVPSPLNDIFDGIRLGVSIFTTVKKGFK